ncbi:MAG TPA: hypothetical protein VF690_15830, partial [Hymenobacter sp.]|jgi:predicted phage tail protein
VTALNANSVTNSPTQRFAVDAEAPTAPVLVTPAAAALFSALPITLSWTRSAPDVVRDSVFLFGANQTTLLTGFPQVSTTTSLVLTNSVFSFTSGTYYWAVRSVNRSGNRSPLSAKRQLILQ